ncbi:TonB-dependent vitamin B12 receptor [Photobacterium leiognathi]|uniref:Vitamin B12 transporter BtuB n=1 Tax=Photobacterium leiognathi TaxID=553611 RepID=A0A2T3M849_PHOLE|nr:TonB-dependent vitamin B12 receptor [Photobacterium leiognathi]KJF98043.1 ligand-gated channel [Photobacterium leiognathi]PSV88585.1 TonB-dependent vitamin B12 receptor [Photobacterium leiognathi]PSW42249.1 TonB-dependent vitamin B12 receptor [Photobacterium leiognathi subsp. mandapamensis]
MKKTLLALAVTSVYFPSFSSIAADDKTQADDVMVVTANRFEQPVTSVLAPFNVVTRQDIDKVQAKTLTEVISLLPGVQVTQNGGRGQLASIMVRGTNSDQVLVLVDGIRMARAAKGAVDFNQIPLTQVERIEFTRGARAALYGSEAIGGVINIITLADVDAPSKTKLNVGIGSHNYQEASASGAYKVGDNGLLQLAAGYEDDKGYNVKPQPGINDGDKHGFSSRNAMIAYHQRFSDTLKGFISTRWYKNQYQYDSSYVDFFTGEPVHQYMQSEPELFDYSAGLDIDLGRYQSKIIADYQHQTNFDYNKASTTLPVVASQDEKFTQRNLQWNNHFTVNENLQLVGGVDWRKESWKDKLSTDAFSRNNTGVYGIGLVNVNDLSLESSMRLDDNQQYGSQFTYNVAGGWYITDEVQLRTSYGTAFKAPNLYQLYSPSYGTDTLNPEKSKNAEIAVVANYSLIDLAVTGYRMEIDNLIGFNNTSWKYYNEPGKSKIKGIEVEADFDTGFLSHQLNFDFKDPRNSKGERLDRREKFSFKWVGTASFGNLDSALTYQYHGKRPDQYGPTGELPAYDTWDLALTYWLQPKLALKGRVANLLDEQYETAGGYEMPGRTYYTSINYQF